MSAQPKEAAKEILAGEPQEAARSWLGWTALAMFVLFGIDTVLVADTPRQLGMCLRKPGCPGRNVRHPGLRRQMPRARVVRLVPLLLWCPMQCACLSMTSRSSTSMKESQGSTSISLMRSLILFGSSTCVRITTAT